MLTQEEIAAKIEQIKKHSAVKHNMDHFLSLTPVFETEDVTETSSLWCVFEENHKHYGSQTLSPGFFGVRLFSNGNLEHAYGMYARDGIIVIEAMLRKYQNEFVNINWIENRFMAVPSSD